MTLPPLLHFSLFAGLLTAWTAALLSPVPPEATAALGEDGSLAVSKSLHVLVYAAIMVLGGTLKPMRTREGWLAAALVTHGALTEFFQQFVGRYTSVRDVLIDALGVFIGSAIVVVWRRRHTGPSGE